MKTLVTSIDGFNIELDTYTERGESRSDCVISKGDYSASLALLEHAGHLDYGGYGQPKDSYELPVRESTVNRIVTWANKNGY